MKKHNLYYQILLVLVLTLFLILPVRNLFGQEGIKANLKLECTGKDSNKMVKATLTSSDTAVKEVDIHFYVRRSFSLLPLEGDNTTTDESGEASVIFPVDLPGDENGDVTIIARIEDNDELGEVNAEKTIRWGVPVKQENLKNKRALWAPAKSAPWSLVIFITGAILGVWGVIFYVIFKLFRIRKLGKIIKL